MNALWQKVNREMVAKILAELEYERTLRAKPVSSDGWRITMGNESWQFRAAQRGVEIFHMLCRLRVAHLQHRRQLQQRAFRFDGFAAGCDQAVRVDMR
ncbi:hypothetical protein, partial [Enterobacter asburiae]|uniref:hypothetical protein n=1 Tax=Enterobacter asburiae TaxID=61645 RepID=UPI000A8F385C